MYKTLALPVHQFLSLGLSLLFVRSRNGGNIKELCKERNKDKAERGHLSRGLPTTEEAPYLKNEHKNGGSAMILAPSILPRL